MSVQAAAMRDALAPVLQLSASLAAGRPTSAKDAQAAAAGAQKGALYTLRRAGKLLWGCLAPCVALEASIQLLEELGGMLVHEVLARKVSTIIGHKLNLQAATGLLLLCYFDV